jgi:hypothetical protein
MHRKPTPATGQRAKKKVGLPTRAYAQNIRGTPRFGISAQAQHARIAASAPQGLSATSNAAGTTHRLALLSNEHPALRRWPFQTAYGVESVCRWSFLQVGPHLPSLRALLERSTSHSYSIPATSSVEAVAIGKERGPKLPRMAGWGMPGRSPHRSPTRLTGECPPCSCSSLDATICGS